MIGDNPMTDIKGAFQIGITGILLAKSPPLPKDGDVPTPDVIVPDLSFLFGDDDTG
jgi:FMN phosphatase YigB (HAD superfamily)